MKGKGNLMRIGARVRSLNRTRPCRLPEQEPRLSHLWQFNFSNSEGTKKAEWRNSNWLVFDSTICSRATEKSRIVCSYSHPGLIRYQQSRLWPCRGRFQKADAKEEKEARAKIVTAYQLVLHVSYWSILFNAPLLKIAIKHIETFVFALYSLYLHTVRLILYKTT